MIIRKGRLEAFSDGVVAIIITIMVLEMKIPHGPELRELAPLVPVFISYLLSFVIVGLYWNNHHHLFLLVEQVDGKVFGLIFTCSSGYPYSLSLPDGWVKIISRNGLW